MNPEPQSLEQRLAMLEQEAQRQREEDEQRHRETRTMLDRVLAFLGDAPNPQPNPQEVPNPGAPPEPREETHTSQSAEPHSRIKAALPADFDGQRKGGQAFLNSCELYLQLAGTRFANDQQRIHWVLTFCKSGRAAHFADRTLRSERTSGVPKFADWAAFVADFKVRFCESNEQVRALNQLEGDSWYQRASSIDDYIDKFEELVDLAGLVPDAGLVMKFRRGLNKDLQDKVAEMESPPNLTDLATWKQTARRIYENVEANRAFTRQARTAPTSTATRGMLPVRPNPFVRPLPNPATFFPRQGVHSEPLKPKTDGSVPMEVDSSRLPKSVPSNCHRCHQPGHWARDCPLRFDVRSMTIEERKDWLDLLLAEADMAHIGATEVRGDSNPDGTAEPVEADFPNSSE